MKFLSSLFVLSLLVFSCGDGADTAGTPEAPVTPAVNTPAPPAAPEPSMLQSTIEAVQSTGGDITALPAGAAVSNINGWIGKLSSMDGTEGIVNDLTALKTELGSGQIDGSKVSGLLSALATNTRNVGGSNPMLGKLADALQAGADKLAGK